MVINERKIWLYGATGLLFSTLIVFIESLDLKGDLDHRYPFKIMNIPPPDYYVEVSNILASIIPYASVATGIIVLMVLKRQKAFAGLIPILMCPISYAVGLWYLVSNGIYRNNLNDIVNFDRSSAAMRHQEFYLAALEILLQGVASYLIFFACVWGVGRLISSRKMS